MYKKVIVTSLLLITGCASNSAQKTAITEPSRSGDVALPAPFSDGFFDSNIAGGSEQWKQDPFAMSPANAQLDTFSPGSIPVSSNSQAFQVFEGAPQRPPVDDLTQGNATLNADVRNVNLSMDPMSDNGQFGIDDPLYPPSSGAMIGGPFIVGRGQAFREILQSYVEPQGFRVIWDTPFNVTYENDVVYDGADLMTVLRAVAEDLNAMAVDIHMNVYLKNKVILVYSVRK